MNRLSRITAFWNRLTLGWKVYLSLTIILLPVFALTIFLQHKMTRPLLAEEARQIGISISKSLATDIIAFKLHNHPDKLEARLIETTWLQPSVIKLEVIASENGNRKVIASNIAEDSPEETPQDVMNLELGDLPRTELKHDEARGDFWEIVYPVRDHRRVSAHIHAVVSMQLANQVAGIFTQTALLGDVLAVALLVLLLSNYVRRMIRTERENAQLTEQLHETQRQLFLNEKLAVMGQLTASFAHEIGTPLNSLSGHLQLLKDEIAGQSSRNRLDIIGSQVTRIEGIVKDFLASTHMPQRQKQLVDVSLLIERIGKLVAPRIASIKAVLTVDADPTLEQIRAVPTELEQVLLNLANNAIDALEQSPNARELRLMARSGLGPGGKKTLDITVTDTGEGISPADMKQVLKPFFTTKAPGQGTGLGLTISQRLVKKYGGRLELDSALGKGTSIKVSIPYDAP